MSTAPLSQSAIWRYSILAVPTAFAGFPVYVLAQDYYATVHAMPLALLGALLLGIRFFDAMLDPVIVVLEGTTGVVGRVDINALYFSLILREQALEGV